MKPEVNQQLFSLNIGNAARNRDQVLTPVVVTKVGRKYFTTRNADDDIGYSDTQYHIDGWCEKSDYAPNSCLYVNRQEWEDEKESSTIAAQIYEYFEYRQNRKGLSLDQLREIAAIISR